MDRVYIIQAIDEYHLMYDPYLEEGVFLTKGDVQQRVDTLNQAEGLFFYGEFENQKSLPKYTYKEYKTSDSFSLLTNNTPLNDSKSKNNTFSIQKTREK